MILCVCPNPSIDILAEVPNFREGKVNRILSLKRNPGGKGIHVAMALQELEQLHQLMGIWGGNTGKWISSKLRSAGIECGGIEIDEDNRSCYTLSDTDQDEQVETEVLEPGPTVTQEQYLAFIEKVIQASALSEVICLSGSWPNGAQDTGYRELIKNMQNKKTLLDCSGSLLENALEAHPYCIHINEYEAQQLFGSLDRLDLIKRLKLHCDLAAISFGKEGLYLMDRNSCIHANVHLDDIYSAVGSGDCLLAGIALAVQHQYSLIEIAKWGVACGAANCICPELGQLLKKDVIALLNRVEIKILEL